MFQYKLGKGLPAKDKRMIKLSDIVPVLPSVPDSWDPETGKNYPLPMFANDQHGCCVIAGRAHQTLRLENIEQGEIIQISDADVLGEYWKEEGGEGNQFDTGLVILDAMKRWKNDGWKIGDAIYKIHAFAAVNPRYDDEVKVTLYYLFGGQAGLALPLSAQDQLNDGASWDVTKGDRSIPYSWGGHCVYMTGKYNEIGPVCVTWGKYQQMTWDFFFEYCDELFGGVNERNIPNSPIDPDVLEQYLAEVSK